MFRLNYLQLKGHHILGTMELLFDTSSNLNEGQLFTTIVIGQNGTGKSNILKVISGYSEHLMCIRKIHQKSLIYVISFA